MNSRTLQNDRELYEYLLQLAATLKRREQHTLAEVVSQASRFASGSPTEFLHEAQLALERVGNTRPEALSASEIQEVDIVLAQIRTAFRKIGGA